MNMSLASLSHATYHDIRLSPEHSVTGLGVAEREAFPLPPPDSVAQPYSGKTLRTRA